MKVLKKIGWVLKNLFGFIIVFFSIGMKFLGPIMALGLFVFLALVGIGDIDVPETFNIDWIQAALIVFGIIELTFIRMNLDQIVTLLKFDIGRRYSKETGLDVVIERIEIGKEEDGPGPKIGSNPGDLAT